MKNNLVISEKFFSLQGEGKTMGVPAIFIRLAGCNLLCKSDSWVCDTIEVWRKGIATPFDEVLSKDDIKKLQDGAHLIITGGEPMLHQKRITEFLQWFSHKYFLPIVEIETNGTFAPNAYLFNIVHYWNVSPKLSTSGEHISKTLNEVALRAFNRAPHSIFKFVITIHEDFIELDNFLPYIDYGKVYLMPSGATQAELAITRPIVAELCKNTLCKYSERLHIVIWDESTGV